MATAWQQLAAAALDELPGMGFDPGEEAEVRAALDAALALPPDDVSAAVRDVLTGRPQLRAWLRERVADPDLIRVGRRPVTRPVDSSGDESVPEPREDDGADGDAFVPEPPAADWGVGDESAPEPPAAVDAPPEPPHATPPETPHATPPETLPGTLPETLPGTLPETLPASPAAATRVVHPRLDAPASVEAGASFPLLVGIAEAPSRGVLADAPFTVPTSTFVLTVSLLLDGFRTADGSSPVRQVLSTPEQPYPAAVVDLVALDDATFRPARTILAEYTIEGQTLGTASTSVLVLPAGEPPPAAAPKTRAAPVVGWAMPAEGAPDLVITVGRGNDVEDRRLLWSANSPHPEVSVPAEPVLRRLDDDAAGDWARRVMRGVEQRRNADDLASYLRGVQRLVGEQVPDPIWAALASAATVSPHPAVLLATAEPFIPWELARVPEPWDAERPPFLGTQANLGRWTYRGEGPAPNPARRLPTSTMCVVKGEYSGSARLPEAEAEADHLVGTYGARAVTAEISAVLDCIRGEPAADVLHFAVHGRLDVTGTQDGIVMNDRTPLGPESILGAEKIRPELVFLNACQVGQQQEMLGDAAGVVPSFIKIGAQAVVAPLWKVDDVAARGFAERFYAALRAGATVSEFFAEERATAAGAASPQSTVLAYVFFGHPRLTVTTV